MNRLGFSLLGIACDAHGLPRSEFLPALRGTTFPGIGRILRLGDALRDELDPRTRLELGM